MTRLLDSLAGGSYDVLVVGGGIVGACAARDTARRGLRVALIERQDFGGGISWNSLKIVHGGLRSLQRLDVRQSRAFVLERRAWLRIAPHLIEPFSFIVPTRGAGAESAVLMRAALAFNDLVSRDRNEGVLPSRRIANGRALSRSDLRALAPALAADHSSGALFHDAQLYSAERLVYAVLDDAVRAGASVASYAEAVAPLQANGSLAGVVARDALTGDRCDVRAAMIVNAAGEGAASVADMLIGRPGVTRPMSGIALNLMIAGDGLTTGFTLLANTGGRARRLFVVPWRGRTLVGTAHYACERPPQSEAELEPYVERFVREVASAWPSRSLTRESVLLVYSGMQPLPHGTDGAPAHGPPEHEIIDHSRMGVPQLLTAIGPKLTMARAIAEQLTDVVTARLGRRSPPCDTASVPLHSAPAEDIPAAVAGAIAEHRTTLPEDVISHLVRSYGNGQSYQAIVQLVRGDPALGARVDPSSPVIVAQLMHAARCEHVLRAEDIVMRRTELGATACVSPSAIEAAQRAIDVAGGANAGGIGDQELRADSEPRARGSRSL